MAGAFLCAVLGLAGCATPQVAVLGQRWPADLPARAELANVPFYPQEDYECGPAALAMAARAAGVPVSPGQLVEQVYLPGRKGSLQQEMIVAIRRQGLLAYPLAPSVEALMREVAAGNPVIVFQNLAFSFNPVWHYAVAIGFDRERNTLLLHSGRSERMEMSLYAFERTWGRGGYWAMLALAPTRLPATAQPDTYVAAVAALERLDAGSAQQAYSTALRAWPTQRAALLGAGNTAYALGQLDRAVNAYQATTRLHPDFADAWNNLAQTLLDQGKTREASQAIAQAVALGGVRLPHYRELQRKIELTK